MNDLESHVREQWIITVYIANPATERCTLFTKSLPKMYNMNSYMGRWNLPDTKYLSTSLKGGHLCGKQFCEALSLLRGPTLKTKYVKNNNKRILHEFIIFFYEIRNPWNKNHIFLEVLSVCPLVRIFCVTRTVCHDESWNVLCEVCVLQFWGLASVCPGLAHQSGKLNWVTPKDKFLVVWRKQICLTLWPFCMHEVI